MTEEIIRLDNGMDILVFVNDWDEEEIRTYEVFC